MAKGGLCGGGFTGAGLTLLHQGGILNQCWSVPWFLFINRSVVMRRMGTYECRPRAQVRTVEARIASLAMEIVHGIRVVVFIGSC